MPAHKKHNQKPFHSKRSQSKDPTGVKSASPYFSLKNAFAFRKMSQTIDEKMAKRIGQDLVEWAQCDDALTWTDFYCYYGISAPVVARYREHNEYFAEAYAIAKALLAQRQHRELLKNNPAAHVTTLPYYHEDFAAAKEDREALQVQKASTQTRGGLSQIVTVEKPVYILESAPIGGKHENNK